MSDQQLQPRQEYGNTIKYDKVCLLKEAVLLQVEYLTERNRQGNQKIADELKLLQGLQCSIHSQIEKYRKQDPKHYTWDAEGYIFSGEQWAILKAVLGLRVRSVEVERQQKLAKGEPPEVVQDIEGKLNLIREFLAWDIFSQVEEYPVIGKNRGMGEKQPQTPGSITINATIHNVGSGIVAVGKDISIQQNFLPLSKALYELFDSIDTSSDLDEKQKEIARGNIQTIQSQLTMQEPDRGIISRAWHAIEKAAAIGGAIEFLARISPLIAPLLIEKGI